MTSLVPLPCKKSLIPECLLNHRSEFEEWLQILEDGLNLQDAYCHSPLKGLPRQKALRKDQQGSLSEDLETISPGVVKSAVGGDNGHSDIIAVSCSS